MFVPASRWTPKGVLQRSLQVLRSEGLRALWFKILGETVYRRLLIVERKVEPSLSEETPSSVEFGQLTLAGIPEYLRFRRITADEVRRRLLAGHQCFVAYSGGEIVHACWVAAGETYIDYLSCPVKLSPGAVYLYEVFTHPDFRGAGLSGQRSRWMERRLARFGFRKLVAAVGPENRAARRSAEKCGYRRAGMIGYFLPGTWRYFFLTGESTLSLPHVSRRRTGQPPARRRTDGAQRKSGITPPLQRNSRSDGTSCSARK